MKVFDGYNLFKSAANIRFLTAGIVIAAAIIITASAVSAQTNNAKSDREKQVRAFVAAFNSHDIERMLAVAEDDVQWLNVNESKVSASASGKKDLRQSMERYFSGCPSCKSSLEWVKETGERVVAFELASWKDKNGKPKSLRSLSVYEFRNSKIFRVYYFPDEYVAQTGKSPK